MASGALPPGLPMVRIGRHYYWDGGLVSNTPLQHLLDNLGAQNMLVFQVDLFSATGEIPRDMPEVLSRQKDIQYSSPHPHHHRPLPANPQTQAGALRRPQTRPG